MNILFYFDRQINPERGGTERVTYNLAHYFQGKGNRVMYLAKHKVEEADVSIKTFFLPDNGSVVSDENISWLENFLREEKIDFLINQGANGDDIYLLSHKALNTKTKIISVLHFSVYQGPNRNYYACLIADATACCSQGIEFVLDGDYTYPDDYPNVNSEITVTGTFDTYTEQGSLYCQLLNATIKR